MSHQISARSLFACRTAVAGVSGAALLLLLPVATARAQSQNVVLSGTVTDPSGALIPHAALTVVVHESQAGSAVRTLETDGAGRFSVGLPAGVWDVQCTAEGFITVTRTVTVGGRATTLDFKLQVAAAADQVDVPSDQSSTASGDNKGALIFKGEQLDALSDNDTTMRNEMLAMTGGSGEGGGQIYVDGFTGGKMPPKDTIREVRINSNPFSPQYEDLGYGRIEVFTKPGTGQLHGSAFSSASANPFNSLNPYTGAEPPYVLLFNRGQLSGPLGKKSSWLGSIERGDQNNNAVVNAFNPDGSRLSLSVKAPITETDVTGRFDRQLNKANTLVTRYERDETNSSNTGVGLLVLPTEGTTNHTVVQTFQAGNTELLGPNLVSETRFQYLRTRQGQTPNSTAPTITVQGAFAGGGAPTQGLSDAEDRYEFQEYLSFAQGNHFLRLGARYRLLHEVNTSTANYNGSFTFPSLAAYQAGQPSLFSLTTGQTTARLLTGDLGAYAEDEWKARNNLTLNVGIRLESQTAIPDHFDPAPRAAFAWALRQTEKHPPLLTIRGSAGLFYSRFAAGNILTSIRQNGVNQLQYLLTNPGFYPTIPDPSGLTETAPTPYGISGKLRVASEAIASVSAERSLGKIGQVTLTYYAVRGVHQYNSENINAPLAGGVRPLGGTSDVYQFSSDGIEKAQVFNVNTNLQPAKWLSLFTFYGARRQNSDTFGAASFPSQPYRVSADYGPSGLGMQPIGQRLFTEAEVKLPKSFFTDMFLGSMSRTRVNITTGTDLNGDTQFNDRPAFATNPGPNSVIYRTKYGVFDANPQPGEQIIPYNYALGPRMVFLAARFGRDFRFGPRPAPPVGAPAAVPGPKGKPAPKPDPKYDLAFSLEGVNVTNTNNAGAPVGVLGSPFFGKSLSTNSTFFQLTPAANRIVFLNASFRF